MKVCITVPIYKDFQDLSKNERKSLRQLFVVLGAHQIYFYSHSKIDVKPFFEYGKRFGAEAVGVVWFSRNFFANIDGYDSLMKSTHFYRAFRKFTYLLIYQLDAWVFRDELEYWCNKGYDYIGAPWFKGWHKPTSTEIIGVGNGGFSLRRVKSFLQIAKILDNSERWRQLWYKSRLQALIRFEKVICRVFSISSYSDLLMVCSDRLVMTEDVFWSKHLSSTFQKFKKASNDDAIRFSFEVQPSQQYKLNNKNLPFGCHAWEKYDPDFWRKHFEIDV